MKKSLLLGGLLLGLGVSLAPPANAQIVEAYTEVSWGSGPNCINYWSAGVDNPYVIGWNSSCHPTHTAAISEHGYTGQWVGVDPEIGSSDWMSCKIWINGVLTESNYARLNDGVEVNCLRKVL